MEQMFRELWKSCLHASRVTFDFKRLLQLYGSKSVLPLHIPVKFQFVLCVRRETNYIVSSKMMVKQVYINNRKE